MKRYLSALLALIVCFAVIPVTAFAAVDKSELEEYYKPFGITLQDVERSLEFWESTIDDFETTEELIEFLGDPLNDENLKALLDEYELTLEELEALLAEYGESLSDYKFYDDLDHTVFFYLYDDDYFEGIEIEELKGLLAEFGITEEELQRLADHIETLDPDELATKLESLYERLMAFEEFDSASDLTPAQIKELLSIYHDLLDAFQLDAKYYLVKHGTGEKKAITIEELLKLDELKGYDLLVALYNKQGEFLADLIIKGELVNSKSLDNVGKDIKKIKEEVKKPQTKTGKIKTVKGAKMPKTASDYGLHMLIGLFTAGIGLVLYRKAKKAA